MSTPDERTPTTWYCGAFEPRRHGEGTRGLRCTEPAGHDSDHAATVDGATLATWPTRFDPTHTDPQLHTR